MRLAPLRLFGILLLLAACTSGPPPVATPSTPARSRDAVAVNQPDMVGLWWRHLAEPGEPTSEQFMLTPDGRYGWIEGGLVETRSPENQGPGIKRAGTWEIKDRVLVLREDYREIYDDASGREWQESLTPPLERRLRLGPCPASERARDKAPADMYCVTFDGIPFWRVGDGAMAAEDRDYFLIPTP